jgi:peptide methionine sulfoxide reductase MsrA
MNLKIMKTKRFLNFFFSLLLFPAVIFAQDKQNRKDRIETVHIAYLTQKLNLTSEEAKNFWPVYDQYKSDQEQLRNQRRDNVEAVEKAGGIDNMNDADVQKLIAGETDLETRELELRKQYVTKFQSVIPIRKVAKFFIAEDEFKRYLLNQLSKRREHGGRGNDE